jgi:fumarate hydratase subunit beta
MDSYALLLIAQGLKGMIGKGARGKEVVEAIGKYKAVYFCCHGRSRYTYLEDNLKSRSSNI